MSYPSSQPSKMVSATLAFFLGIVGADLFYRRDYLAGLGVFAILIVSFALMPIMGDRAAAVLDYVPTLLVLYGWFRAFMYVKSKGR